MEKLIILFIICSLSSCYPAYNNEGIVVKIETIRDSFCEYTVDMDNTNVVNYKGGRVILTDTCDKFKVNQKVYFTK